MNENTSPQSPAIPPSKRTKIYELLKQGPVIVGEVRGCHAETGKKFDKSDKNAPPLIFGVLKVNIELIGDGAPVMVSIYPGQGENVEGLVERLALNRGTVVAIVVNKSEFKDGFRKVVSNLAGIHVLDDEQERNLRAA